MRLLDRMLVSGARSSCEVAVTKRALSRLCSRSRLRSRSSDRLVLCSELCAPRSSYWAWRNARA